MEKLMFDFFLTPFFFSFFFFFSSEWHFFTWKEKKINIKRIGQVNRLQSDISFSESIYRLLYL